MTHSLCMHHIIKKLHNDKASQINIFTKKLEIGQHKQTMSFFIHFYFESVLSLNTYSWLANIYYSYGIAKALPVFATHFLNLISAVFQCFMISILRQMKKFVIKLMNWLPHFVTQSIDRYDGLDERIFFLIVWTNCI